LEVAGALINLALLNALQKHYDEADALNERSLRILAKVSDSAHPLTGSVLNNMGFVSFGRHQYAKAQEQFLHAIEAKRKSGPELDPSLAAMYRNLGDVYATEKRYVDAKSCYGEAIRIWDATSGPLNPQLATPLENYARVLRKTEDFAEAEQAETRALGIRVRNSLVTTPH
jgi:tetratricopeptide (TPR) repeat protein